MSQFEPSDLYKSSAQLSAPSAEGSLENAEGSGGKPQPDNGRHGVVAIVVEEDRLLIIRRSPLVRAPNLLCLPGGGIEPGETLNQAMHREMQEELGISIQVERHLWSSVTRWGTRLEWLICSRVDATEPKPNPWEVSEYLWMTLDELRGRDDLLGSLPDFFAAIDRQEISWP